MLCSSTLRLGKILPSQERKIIPTNFAFTVKKGDGSRKLAVFTDPDCPYCKKIETELQDVDNVTIYYFMLPIDKLHPNARKKAAIVWCSKDKATAWYDMMLKAKNPEGDSTCDTPLDQISKFASMFRISATPTLINDAGAIMEGAPRKAQLQSFMNAK